MDINLLFEAAKRQIAHLNRNQVANLACKPGGVQLVPGAKKAFQKEQSDCGRGGYTMAGRFGGYASFPNTVMV